MSALEAARLRPERVLPVKPHLELPKLRVETVSSYQQFLGLRSTWNRLVDESSIDHPFLEHDWIRTWWDCFGGASQLNIVLVWEGDDLIGIAPLILTRVHVCGLTIRRLGFFTNEHVPRADFIISARAKEVYQAIWKHLCQQGGWDVLRLSQLKDDSETLQVLPSLASRDSSTWGLWFSSASPYIDIERWQSWRSYFDSLENKFRANLRNRFKRVGEVQVVTAIEPDSAQLQAAFDLEAAAWKGRAGTAISCDPAVRRFYTEFASCAGRNGWLRLSFLCTDAADGAVRLRGASEKLESAQSGAGRCALETAGQPIACSYLLEYKNSAYVLKSGYDPRHAAFSPTNLLHCRTIENSFARNLKRYDFLGDSAEWKLRWTKDTSQYFWLFVFPSTIKGKLLHAIKFRLISRLKRVRG